MLEASIAVQATQHCIARGMAVQIKSSANQTIIDEYAARLGLRAPGERLMLVCHSPEGTLRTPHAQGDRTLELLVGEAVAERAIRAGLVDWVMQRAQ